MAALALVAPAHGGGGFRASDALLTDIWSASARTAALMVSAPERLDPRGCPVPFQALVLDGLVRDRCPWVGDLVVTGKTLMAAGADLTALRNTVRLFGAIQRGDGAIPPSPLSGNDVVLFDYSAYWIEAVHDLAVRGGELGVARELLPAVALVLDRWYRSLPAHGALVANTLGDNDYAFIRRRGPLVAYYNAQYARTLALAADLAGWLGEARRAAEWRDRSRAVSAAVGALFWDAGAGAVSDGPGDPSAHPQDGNAFAVLAGALPRDRAVAALRYLERANRREYGNAIVDSNAWDAPHTWGTHGHERVYPFMSYFELLARFQAGLDHSAFDLVRRTWGYMLRNGPGTAWEAIGPFGSPFHGERTSFAHGWSTGAAPALTDYVLGVRPLAPGYRRFEVAPHPGDLTWAEGTVPTPYGEIGVRWTRGRGCLQLRVVAPRGTSFTTRGACRGRSTTTGGSS